MKASINALSREARVVTVQEQVSCNLGDEVVVLQLRDGHYFGLNPVGASVWKLVQTPRTIGEIHRALLEEYAVEAEQCERDLLQLLQKMSAAGLVQISHEQDQQNL